MIAAAEMITVDAGVVRAESITGLFKTCVGALVSSESDRPLPQPCWNYHGEADNVLISGMKHSRLSTYAQSSLQELSRYYRYISQETLLRPSWEQVSEQTAHHDFTSCAGIQLNMCNQSNFEQHQLGDDPKQN